jgi:hypothetical protein
MSRAPESVYLKLLRAQGYVKAIEADIQRFGKEDSYAVTFEPNDDRRQVAGNVMILRQLPEEWPLIVGDCIHNYRGALDHLAFALPREPGTDPEWETLSQFPICLTPEGFASVNERHLMGVSDDAVRVIERMQPYFRRDEPETHGLAYLRHLSNLDKHRLSPFVWAIPTSGNLNVPKPPTGSVHAVFTTGHPEHGDTILKLYFSEPAPIQVNMNLELSIGVTLRDLGRPDNEPMGVTLVFQHIYERVVAAISRLEPFLA